MHLINVENIHFRMNKQTKEQLNLAKKTLDEKYLVVGLTEDLPSFFEFLEIVMPHMFYNATETFLAKGEFFYRCVNRLSVSSIIFNA